MHTKTKVFNDIKVKHSEGDAEGTFEAYASTYTRDSVGDRVVPGAFKNAIAKAEQSGSHWPVLWSHDSSDPFANIGQVLEAKETDEGLYVKGVFDLEDNPTARQVYKLVKSGRCKQLSFQYSVLDGGFDESAKADDGQQPDYLLKELDVYEISFCHLGANQATRVLSAKSEELASRVSSLETVLTAALGKEIPVKADESYTGEAAADALVFALRELKKTVAGLVEWRKSFESETEGKEAQTEEPLVTDEEPTDAKSNDEEPTDAKSENATPTESVDALLLELDLIKSLSQEKRI